MLFITSYCFSQQDVVDTARPSKPGLRILGYIIPQFQVAQQKGIESYEGGNFSQFSNNRFMLRESRLISEYQADLKNKFVKQAFLFFQIDATERGISVRDAYIQLSSLEKKNLSLTMGAFLKPFGYEVNLFAIYRESPERGRMSQILLPGEKDIGAMLSYETLKQNINDNKPLFKVDVGVFNGEGLSGPTDYDSYKDVLGRLRLKPYNITEKLSIAAGASFYTGGWMQATKYKYETATMNGNKLFVVDSAESNPGTETPRHYFGGDAQIAYKHTWGKTEVRAEYWRGKQPGTATSTTSPGTLPTSPTYIRRFDGAFIYFIQSIVNKNWELVAKYDWYDPNTDVELTDIGKMGTNFTPADIKYSTFGFGLTHYFSDNFKMLAYYAIVRNEKTLLQNYNSEIKDNVFTFRMLFRF